MKKILFSVLMLAALASCTKNDSIENLTDDSSEIKVGGSALSALTRTPFEGTAPSAANPLTAHVFVTSVSASLMGNHHVHGNMTFTGTNAVAFGPDAVGTRQYLTTTDYFVYGLAPSSATDLNVADQPSVWKATDEDKATFIFTGYQDVMAAPEKTTKKADATTGTFPKLEFKHLLTQVEVWAVCDGSAAVASSWGVVKDVMLTNGQFGNKIEVMPSNATVLSFSNPATDWQCYGFDNYGLNGLGKPVDTAIDPSKMPAAMLPVFAGATTAPSEAALKQKSWKVAYTMVQPFAIPQTTGDPHLYIKVKTGNKTDNTKDTESIVPVKLQSSWGGAEFTGDATGRKFIVFLVFKEKSIQASASVTDWVAGGTATSPVD